MPAAGRERRGSTSLRWPRGRLPRDHLRRARRSDPKPSPSSRPRWRQVELRRSRNRSSAATPWPRSRRRPPPAPHRGPHRRRGTQREVHRSAGPQEQRDLLIPRPADWQGRSGRRSLRRQSGGAARRRRPCAQSSYDRVCVAVCGIPPSVLIRAHGGAHGSRR